MTFFTSEINIGRIFDFIHLLVRKDPLGNTIAPGIDFDSLCQAAAFKYFKKIFGLPDEYQKGSERARYGYELNSIMTEKIRPLKTSAELAIINGASNIPTDMFRHGTIVMDEDEENPIIIDVCNDAEWADRIVSFIDRPTEDSPICNFTATAIKFNPTNIDNISMSYIKYPTNPTMGYVTDYDTAELYYVNKAAYLVITAKGSTGSIITITSGAVSIGSYTVQALDTIEDVMKGIVAAINVNQLTTKVKAVYDGEKIVIIDYTGIYTTLTVEITGTTTYTKENFITRSVNFDWINDGEAMQDIIEIMVDMIGISNRDDLVINWAEKEKAS